MNKLFPGIWKKDEKIITQNLVPGDKTYTKNIFNFRGREYREWNPFKSKACAAIACGLREFPLKSGLKVLYLGISFGQTATFFSDIIGKDGIIYGVELSERCLTDLNSVAEKRGNIVPILGDARKPDEYGWIEPVDLIYEDVASDDQAEIMIRNSSHFLKPGGFAMIAIKARSIDVVKEPRIVFKEQLEILKKHFEVVETRDIEKFEKDHLFVVLKRKT
ncbi:MAG: fibrillarin-like rRNA/tRNA 2'-O-methyltransferase [Candidatus Aenigmarchaeota archaeon]|nr:fibrillarin-like rRNA/tRNA 2'-O-methyltransferase [Candidatus Aenigmarchaeota archaeon]